MPPIEDTFERVKEKNFIKLLQMKYLKKPSFLKSFPIDWKYTSSKNNVVYNDVTWTEMKTLNGWGFSKGKPISILIDWIFLRPDIESAINANLIKIDEVICHGILNYHFFIVKTKAVSYFLSVCIELVERPEFESESEEDDLEPNRAPMGIDDEAVVKKRKIK
jgi:hypothetical protein